ncbi:cytochrome c oxidase assembly protein [Colletotrichum plurivorum]|uniref:Cytochrome c oxidase assembly protein n=1 Tax=Colletotrichum plurivorum TaxID=2175906 RepID=A0A8H6JAF0_9PEZI|nr:cytochrome c oxidase assembly protein [Colletotrichum plurivorum]
MSRASKLTLAATSLFAASTIVIVHFQQKFEKEAMHQGVIRDMELQRIKRERQLDFDMQRTLEEEYKREQTVRESPTPDSAPIGGGRENQGRAQ